MNAFVTGAAGFIGSYAVQEFVQQGWHVFALVHKKTSPVLDELATSGSITIVQADLDDFATLESDIRELLNIRGVVLDAIVHCAGRASDVGKRSAFRKANFESVQNLCDLAGRMDVGRLVFVSTTDVYGLRDFGGEREDELPLRNNTGNPYPEFKILAEECIRNSLPLERFAIIRPGAVWGLGDATLTPRIVSFLKSSPWIIHFGKWRGENRWPLAHVRNVATAIYLAATLPEAAGMATNVLDGQRTTMDEFYRIMASIYQPRKKLRSITLPMWIGKAFGTVISGISNALNLDHPFIDPSLYALQSVSSNLDFDNDRMARLLVRGKRYMISRDQAVEELRRHLANAASDDYRRHDRGISQ